MTTVYFIRHAEPNYKNHDDFSRELTAKGMADREKVTVFLKDTHVDVVLSSPFLRSIQTVEHFAQSRNLPISLVEDFRERKVSRDWISDFNGYSRKQWADFDYKLPGGECLAEVQSRTIAALTEVLTQYRDKTVVIGSHGTALGTILAYYDPGFGYDQFLPLLPEMPFIAKLEFEELRCIRIQIDL